VEESPPLSPQQPAPPTPGCSSPAETTLAPTEHEQTDLEGMLSNQPNVRHEIDPHLEAALDDEEYLDYSVSSDAGDDGPDSPDADGSDVNGGLGDNPNANDGLDDGPDVNGGSHNLEAMQSQEELAWVEPTIVHYPGNRAGEVCSKGIMVMQDYENALGGPSENPYAPFSSQVDWELAKWAKLRGPSATSFTELLNIGRVSTFNKSPHSIVSTRSSSSGIN
jgi:hypothetical protein